MFMSRKLFESRKNIFENAVDLITDAHSQWIKDSGYQIPPHIVNKGLKASFDSVVYEVQDVKNMMNGWIGDWHLRSEVEKMEKREAKR